MRELVLLFAMAVAASAADGDLQRAHIGDLPLEKGGTIQDCVVAYRTFGTLNAAKSNTILFPTVVQRTFRKTLKIPSARGRRRTPRDSM